jgi:hypothetical protein
MKSRWGACPFHTLRIDFLMIYSRIQRVAEAGGPLSDPRRLRLGLFIFRTDFFIQFWISMLWIWIA